MSYILIFFNTSTIHKLQSLNIMILKMHLVKYEETLINCHLFNVKINLYCVNEI